jgi:hypothetical protein
MHSHLDNISTIHTASIMNLMKEGFFWEANTHLTNQTTLSFYRKMKVHYHVQKSLSLDIIQSHINSDLTLPLYSFKINFIIIFSSMIRSFHVLSMLYITPLIETLNFKNFDKYSNGFYQCVARQQLCKHGPTRNNRGNSVFCRSDQRANRLAG